MLRTLILCIMISASQILFAAAPVIHVYFAELYFKKCKPAYNLPDREAFIVGTLFPDIRYPANIPRKTTHVKQVKLTDVLSEKNPFNAGKLFHSYVDEQREKSAQRQKIYTHIKEEMPKKTRFIKLLEDELCYTKINAQTAIGALNKYDKGEEQFGIPFYKVWMWHWNLQDYLSQSPLTTLTKRVRTKRGYYTLNLPETRQLYSLMEHYCKDQKVINYVHTLVVDFEKTLVPN